MKSTLALFLFLFLQILSNSSNAENIPKKDDQKSVQLSKVEEKNFAEILLYPAQLDYESKALLRTPVAGEIEWKNIAAGSLVKKGQLLALVKNNDPLFNYRAAHIVSTIDGMLAETMVGNLSEVSKDQAIAVIVRPHQFIVTVEVPADKITTFSKIKKGEQFGELELVGEKNKLPLTLHGLAPFVDHNTGTAKAEFTLDLQELNKNKAYSTEALIAGRLVRASFQGDAISGLVVPETSLNFKGRETYVGVVENNIYKRRTIEVASKKDGLVLIKAGLKVEDFVVIRSSGLVKDGAKVEVLKN